MVPKFEVEATELVLSIVSQDTNIITGNISKDQIGRLVGMIGGGASLAALSILRRLVVSDGKPIQETQVGWGLSSKLTFGALSTHKTQPKTTTVTGPH